MTWGYALGRGSDLLAEMLRINTLRDGQDLDYYLRLNEEAYLARRKQSIMEIT